MVLVKLMRALDLSKLANRCLSKLEADGCEIRAFQEFVSLREYIGQVEKESITPKMDPLHNDFLKTNCCWFSLIHGGEVIGVIGTSLQDIGEEDASTYLERTTNRHYGQSKQRAVSACADSRVLGMTGRLAYIGEFLISKHHRGRRSRLRPFMLLVKCLVALEWQPDFFYAFFRERDAIAKMPFLYGFTECIPEPLTWHVDYPGRGDREWIAITPIERFEHSAKVFSNSVDWLGIV